MQLNNRRVSLAGAAACLLTVAALGWPLADVLAQCTSTNGACCANSTVPCNNATCVNYSPPTSAPYCGLVVQAVAYSATAAPGWQNCRPISNPNNPSCTETLQTCANVYVYKATPCNAMNNCGSTTNRQCAATQYAMNCNPSNPCQ